MIALIDGDIIVYKSCFAVEKQIYTLYINNEEVKFDERQTKTSIKKYIKDFNLARESVRVTVHRELEPENHAFQIAKTIIKRILKETKSDGYKLFITSNDKSNYRFKVATIKEYKGNRKTPKPFYYEKVRSYLTEYWGAKEVKGQEADDQLGIAQSIDSKIWIFKSIICSIDKDLLMIPGLHYNIDKQSIVEIDDYKAYVNFYGQMLTGDVSDNIPGIYGVGKKTVESLFEPVWRLKDTNNLTVDQFRKELEKVVKKQYIEAFPTYTKEQLKECYLEIGRLLWIRRTEGEVWNG